MFINALSNSESNNPPNLLALLVLFRYVSNPSFKDPLIYLRCFVCFLRRKTISGLLELSHLIITHQKAFS